MKSIINLITFLVIASFSLVINENANAQNQSALTVTVKNDLCYGDPPSECRVELYQGGTFIIGTNTNNFQAVFPGIDPGYYDIKAKRPIGCTDNCSQIGWTYNFYYDQTHTAATVCLGPHQ